MNLLSLTAVELGKKIKAHEVTVEEATRAALDAIRAKEKDINSFVTVDEESAMIRAKEVQKMIRQEHITGVRVHSVKRNDKKRIGKRRVVFYFINIFTIIYICSIYYNIFFF